MCLIIVTQKPASITRREVQSALKCNPHGVGWMYYDKAGRLISVKWPKLGLKKLWPLLREAATKAEKAGSEFAVHFRYRTSGPIDAEHTHPYPVTDGVLMMHNGIIQGLGNKETSDTMEYAFFVNALLDGKPELLRNPALQKLIGRDITSQNRLVFGIDGDREKRFHIVNRYTGTVWDGKWYSNLYAWDAHTLTGGKLGVPARLESDTTRGNPSCDVIEAEFNEVTGLDEFEYQNVADYIEESYENAVELLETVAYDSGNSYLIAALDAHYSGTLDFQDILDVEDILIEAYREFCAER